MAAGQIADFRIGTQSIGLAVKDEDQRQVIQQRLNELPELFDLAEPFGRIREAIEEAQQAVR